jgi:hypothetical protein
LSRRSFWSVDKATGNADGDANPGERVEIRARLKNESDVELQNVVLTLTSPDDVTIVNGQRTHATWPASVARTSNGFQVQIGAGATDPVTFRLDVTADNGGPWQFTYSLPIVPLPIVFTERNFWARDKVTGNADGDANPGERVEIKVRLKNDSLIGAENVVATLTSADDVTLVNGEVTHATWPAGVARNNDGFLVEIGPGVAGSVAFTLNVTADNGGPWQFSYSLPVVSLPMGFAARNFWARDKLTGNADGDVTLVRGELTHATWPGGTVRNNDGLLVEIGAGVTGSVAFTLDITADNGGPWQFTYSLPVVAAPVHFSKRGMWAFDKRTGNADKNANPGARVHIRARMLNDSLVDASNVVAALRSDDGVSIISGEVTHATWPAGVARNNNGFVVVIGGGVADSVSFTLDVTADSGGPWQFTYTLPVVELPSEFAFRSAWSRDKDTGDADGQAEPGERVELRVRLRNEGQSAANVVLTLSTTDEDVTVEASTASHATWGAVSARTSSGFLVDLGANVGASVAFVVDVTADGAGPWQFEFDLPVSLPAAPSALAVPEDIDLDGVVGIHDILTLAAVSGQAASALPAADLNDDRLLDFADMVIVESARAEVVIGAPSSRRTPAGFVERWLRESRESDDGSRVFRDGIPALEVMLASLRPAVSALLQNYPNPFNPETWIPFDLSKASDVTVRVYDTRGHEVRRVSLGHLDAGSYRGRSDAAHWDGRNALGEPVASGVYIVELRAGDYVERRRMVVRK